MRITPLDIRNHPFGKRLRGYDPDEVDAFLAMVAEDYEAVVRESETLRKQLAKLERKEALEGPFAKAVLGEGDVRHLEEHIDGWERPRKKAAKGG